MHKAAEKKRKELEGRRRTELPLVFMRAAPRFWELGFDAARLCRRLCCGKNGRRVRENRKVSSLTLTSVWRAALRLTQLNRHLLTSCLGQLWYFSRSLFKRIKGGFSTWWPSNAATLVTLSIYDQSMLDPGWSGATVANSYRHRAPLFSTLVMRSVAPCWGITGSYSSVFRWWHGYLAVTSEYQAGLKEILAHKEGNKKFKTKVG